MRVLLAVDDSAASELAAKEVAARPWPPGTTLVVLTVVEPSYAWNIPGLEQDLKRSAESLVRHAAETVQAAGLQVTPMVLAGDPKTVILDRAAEMSADLVVLGSHKGGGLTRFLLGSVARTVLRFAPCSVEIVRGEFGPGIRRVLLATDGSDCSQAAARSIARRPWPAGSSFRVVSVVELHAPLFHAPYPAYLDPKAMEEARGEAMQRAQQAIACAEKTLCDARLETSSTVLVPTATAKELILQEADQWGPDLIVLGSHGRRGFSRFMLGSVSEAVALHARCSVEIIREQRA